MGFNEIVSEYEKRGIIFDDAEKKSRGNDEDWIGGCFRCDRCGYPMLHDDEVHHDEGVGFVCDECSG
jgi:hypothetical protein